ncbi:MAG: alpha-ribazole phosphatase [Desulfuromonas sp.]|uniref:alpha-ribazole phosphatase n=1 Tax=Desulfuromonas sp. TaxID=892 RepID=UPI000CAD6BF6|nr:alpha-ribazole phosphatase [Desulfuromonas sp.]PLX83743.1 MAG: alpha-ribazole phosphatase [Desulfuromonas sp.]
MQRTRIYLVRHGQVEGHEEKRYNGQADVALTELGRRQYRGLKERLDGESISAVYSSDLSRCLEGARPLAAGHGLEPVPEPRLRELHIGRWEGKTWKELQAAYPEEWQARLDDLVHHRVTGGESLLEMAERVRPAVKEIVTRHVGEEVLVVAHGGVNRVILLDAIGAPLDKMFHIEQGFGCLNVIDYFADGYRTVQLLNG